MPPKGSKRKAAAAAGPQTPSKAPLPAGSGPAVQGTARPVELRQPRQRPPELAPDADLIFSVLDVVEEAQVCSHFFCFLMSLLSWSRGPGCSVPAASPSLTSVSPAAPPCPDTNKPPPWQGRFSVWGTTPGGASVLLRLHDFCPYFYVPAPVAAGGEEIDWGEERELQRVQAGWRQRAAPVRPPLPCSCASCPALPCCRSLAEGASRLHGAHARARRGCSTPACRPTAASPGWRRCSARPSCSTGESMVLWWERRRWCGCWGLELWQPLQTWRCVCSSPKPTPLRPPPPAGPTAPAAARTSG